MPKEIIGQINKLDLFELNEKLRIIQRIIDNITIPNLRNLLTVEELSVDVSFGENARINYTRITPYSITLTVGSSADDITDIKTPFDGNFYHIDEAAATPGIDFIIDFVSVSSFNFVDILGVYDGAATHSVAIQLYNWRDETWDTIGAMQTAKEDVSTANGYILNRYSIFTDDDSNYISLGKVRIRLYHTMAGNSSHDLYLDFVALYN